METPKYLLDFEKPLRSLAEELERLRRISQESKVDVSAEIESIEAKIEKTKKEIYEKLTVWQKVQLARHPKRPYSLDYIKLIFEDFQELHGDRCFGDDQAIIGGTALLNGQAIMLIAQQKGRSTKENLMRNFGSPNPEGYRKALRLMRLAEKFKLPIISLVDTPGAYPGIGSEQRHVAEAIAVNLREMSQFSVPSIAVVIGEGGSGGALGIAVSDIVMIFENAYYSVISPEGCAAILWKDRVHAPKAAEALRLSAEKLLEMGIVDEVIKEPFGGAHLDYKEAADNLKEALLRNLQQLSSLNTEDLLEKRYQKYRKMGIFEEKSLIGA
ncbi:MAG: acetyl-CoA carboxylase carboxyltransferase subunit alpha [Verrucomicrobia bacterium GWC2_42_7]|nr:MAG: acetyl-CoA carboxylase carboxyltransferase subunit alpha [Verrucomicrobia bacterium GWC2_42_7]